MSKKKSVKPSETADGDVGLRGRRGLRGLRGDRGPQGPPGISPEALEALSESLEQIKADAAIQFERIAQVQAQLDMTLKALREIGEKARARKRS